MRRMWPFAFVPIFLIFAGLGCTAEDKRQWNEAMREWRGDNIRFGSRDRTSP